MERTRGLVPIEYEHWLPSVELGELCRGTRRPRLRTQEAHRLREADLDEGADREDPLESALEREADQQPSRMPSRLTRRCPKLMLHAPSSTALALRKPQ